MQAEATGLALKRSGMLVSFWIRHPAYLRVRVGLVVGGSLSAEGLPLFAPLFREINTLDATPALSALGKYLAHLFDWVIGAAVVAKR
jgi:hypothetical protein